MVKTKTALLSTTPLLLLCTLGAGWCADVLDGDGGLVGVSGAVLQELLLMGQDAANTVGYGRFENIKIIVFTPAKEVVFKIADASRLVRSIDASRPTVIYLHGYTESRASESVQVVAKAFLQRGSHNFVLFDYGEYVGMPYVIALLRLPMIAKVVGGAVNAAVRAGLSRDGLWIVGHSLGGQLAGMIPKHLDFKPRRITGLDPAGPGFGGPGYPSLSRRDAVFVDVIHTDAGGYGYGRPCGHVDFWPNGGRRFQPGSLTTMNANENWVFYSHHRSWQFFAESLNRDLAFPAVLCDSWIAFKLRKCPDNGNNTVFLGCCSEKTGLQGNFYLRTGGNAPYGLGRSGLNPAS